MAVTLALPIYRQSPLNNLVVQVTNLGAETFINIRFTVKKLSGESNIVTPKASGPLLPGAVLRAFESDWTNYPSWTGSLRVRATLGASLQYSETTVIAV
jgi:hypothetical protein